MLLHDWFCHSGLTAPNLAPSSEDPSPTDY